MTSRGRSPWGFDVADIRVPVIVRHGDEDGFVSITQGRWLAAHIPGARFDEMPGGGHTTVGVPIDPVSRACSMPPDRGELAPFVSAGEERADGS